MPRAIWSGAISFGLVNIPVKLYSAVSRKTVRFNQLDGKDGTRIQQKRVNPATGDEVPYERIVKGYELAPDRYVVITPEELDAIEPKKTQMIEIEDFVELEQIDPIFYDHPYYLAPGKGATKAYALLIEAMEQSGRVGIARVVIRSKEQLVALRARGGVLHMETMLFGDEVIPPNELEELPEPGKVSGARKREVEMARELIDSLAADFDPSKYHDEYRERVLELIEDKAEGREIAVQPVEEAPAEVPDLMAALEASIASAKRQGGGAKKPALVDGDGAEATDGKPKAKAKSAGKSKSAATNSKSTAGNSKSKAAASNSKSKATPAKKRAPAKKKTAAKK
ncbi:MAG TPA: Ku protein [Thermoleophilaceae bacterium]|nr:Ku protein [Thermoleophilaceae bacterium]